MNKKPIIDLCKKVKIDDAKEPSSRLLDCFLDHWWVVTPNEEILLYQGCSPQCNSNQKIAEDMRNRILPGYEVRQIPVVFLPIRSSDYRYDLSKFK